MVICHTLAYSSILISSATELPLLTITSTLHARSISLAFVLFKVGLPNPNWNCLNDLGIYSRHVLQAGTLAGYDCHISGNKKAQSLDRALKLVNIWVAALKFKPLRLKLSRHWVPWYCFHGTFLKALKKPMFEWAFKSWSRIHRNTTSIMKLYLYSQIIGISFH